MSITSLGTANGKIDALGDYDWYRVELTQNTLYQIIASGLINPAHK